MPSLSNLDPELQFVLIKGEPGTRKSTMALSYPGRQFWGSYDRKMQGIILPFKLWKLPADHVDYEDYQDWTNFRKKLEGFRASCPYNTIVVDSVTSMADMTLREILKDKGAGKTVGQIRVNTYEDFNGESSAIAEMIALLKDIQGYHNSVGKKITVILIAHVIKADYSKDGVTNVSRSLVTASKKVAAKIPAYCTEVYHADVKAGLMPGVMNYRILTQHIGDDFARTSLGLPSEIIVNDEQFYSKFVKPAVDKLKV